MTLRFQWDSLRRGDRFLALDPPCADRPLRVISLARVNTSSGRRGLASRHVDASVVVQPECAVVRDDEPCLGSDGSRCPHRVAA
jgi:hypothetical protein